MGGSMMLLLCMVIYSLAGYISFSKNNFCRWSCCWPEKLIAFFLWPLIAVAALGDHVRAAWQRRKETAL